MTYMRDKILAFDLDDVICKRDKDQEFLTGFEKYRSCEPIQEMIDIINECYEENIVIIYTARGMLQYKGNVEMCYAYLYTETEYQLHQWGVYYHKLVMGKLHYDLLIDDKAVNSVDVTTYKELDVRT